MESPEAFYAIKDDLINELWKVAQRELATGFYYKHRLKMNNCLGHVVRFPQYKFVGEVVDFDPSTMTATIHNGMSSMKATKWNSTDQASVILNARSKTCMIRME